MSFLGGLSCAIGFARQRVSDGGGNVWLGSLETKILTGILCALDTLKRGMEIKLLLSCTSEDIQIIQKFHGEMFTLDIPKP